MIPSGVRRPAAAVGGLAVLLGLWQLLAWTAGSVVFPSPAAIAAEVWRQEPLFLLRPALRTLAEAAAGFAVGTALALVVGGLCVRFPRFTPVGVQFAVLTYTVPVIALGAVLSTLWSPTAVRVTIAALFVVFTTVMGTILGLRSADPASLDLLACHGATPNRSFALVRVPSAVPSVLTAMRIAAPAAVLGAIIGQYLGGDGGLGVAMVAAQRSGVPARTWALGIAAAVMAAAVAVPFGVAERRWSDRAPASSTHPSLPPVRTVPAALASAAAAVLVAVGLWYALLWWADVDAFVARTPRDVVRYLFSDADAASQRSEVLDALGVTLGHSAVGLLVGMAAGLGTALLCAAVPRLGRWLLPAAIGLQAVPFVAFVPLATLLAGRGLVVVAVMAGLVSFFPTLVNVHAGLHRTPPAALDLLEACGARAGRRVLMAQLPYAAPAVFTAARIAIPASVAGALLVEWLVLGNGLGALMLGAANRFRYDTLWASVAVVSAVTGVMVAVAGSAERLTADRLGLSATVG